MIEDQRSAGPDGEGVPPETKGEPESDSSGRHGIHGLAREVRADPRHADHQCVQRLLEVRAAELDAADECLGVRDGRWPRERRCRRYPAPDLSQDVASHRAR